jgi:hypothetical protein
MQFRPLRDRVIVRPINTGRKTTAAGTIISRPAWKSRCRARFSLGVRVPEVGRAAGAVLNVKGRNLPFPAQRVLGTGVELDLS